MQNQNITTFLEYYCSPERENGYAVMLSGGWGSGKTYFMQQFIDAHPEYTFLHVSVYGVKNTADIEDLLFQKIHPILESGNVTIGKKILTRAFKNALQKAGRHTDPSGMLPEFLFQTQQYVLIFDDIERCEMPISELFGYINYHIEFQKQKVLLLANEQEIEDTEYSLVKEKIIGKTFEVQTLPEQAIDVFIHRIKNEDCRSFFLAHRAVLLRLFHQSGYSNLRVIKQGISDFEYFFSQIEGEIKQSSSLMKKVFIEFFIYAIEIKKGNFTQEDVDSIYAFSHSEGNYAVFDVGRKAIDKKDAFLKFQIQYWGWSALLTYFLKGLWMGTKLIRYCVLFYQQFVLLHGKNFIRFGNVMIWGFRPFWRMYSKNFKLEHIPSLKK